MNVSHAGIAGTLWTHIRAQALVRNWGFSDALFAEIDGFAWVQGWAIDRRPTRHIYRDPRFDRVVGCRACGGSGRGESGRRCRVCKGDGLLNFVEPPAAGTGA
ncbi:hypothetical protein Sme01_64420 [Sphaerisporangium melleum]|uniref:Uncharacterized protein n=1 Tax=Sphaerisporangium melleum TaxID=321316 RepID=A0A917VPG5_9ACTN|nr:hypothetical protein [Sphaerisporangium melleum]GGL04824.1 hypothetical protein GCM10007964_53780 [Sphaerisporangium melleum]GII73966.1 hypothetical protein Sme01_64420 [Sphaerisporangium melleum]